MNGRLFAADDDQDDHHTPNNEPLPSPWGRNETTDQRPSASRRSTPRSLFGSGGASSIFGSGNNSSNQLQPQRPTLNVRSPSPDDARLDPPLQTASAGLPSRDSAPARRERRYEDEVRATVDRRRIRPVEKDADDPSDVSASQSRHERQRSSTLTTLSRLFAVQAATSPEASRTSSYMQYARQNGYTRQTHGETAALPEHLYKRGLLEGRHSDITVHAFGKEYKLHRLILDRAPFFATALSEPWLEANSKEMTVRPEEIDASITQHSFELALRRLYGCPAVAEEDAHAVGLFATGCWLEMIDVMDLSVESMLRQMSPETLAPLINLVTKNYYGKSGDRILASAKAMLCRDGWRMPLRLWDGIPADVVREIVGGDGFFVEGEWERWILAKRILDRRLKARALEAGLIEPGTRRKIAKAPPIMGMIAVRFDAVARRAAPAAFSHGVPDNLAKYVSLYTHPTVEPILVLLDEGIHYIHLDFEQLQYLRRTKDIIGLPVMPDKVVSNALWQQMELRQRVMNARDTDLELGLAIQATEDESLLEAVSPPSAKGKRRAADSSVFGNDYDQDDDDFDSQSWDGTGRPRKFWIPSSDCNIVMGGNAEPFMATSSSNVQQRPNSRLSATIHPEDVTWAADFATSTTAAQPRPSTSDGTGAGADIIPPALSYTHLPPFRFSADFPAPRLLKERKRVYSRTVFYAGSLWNIYIQKVHSARSTKQLGVYLHRAKERETEEAVYGGAGGATRISSGSVEGRIGMLERDMVHGSGRRRGHRNRESLGDNVRLEGEESSSSAGEAEANNNAAASSSTSRFAPLPDRRHRKTGQTDVLASASPTAPSTFTSLSAADSSESSSEDDSSMPRPPPLSRSLSSSKPALPPYVDGRPTIRTYFKIYSPSRGGRMLSVYESAPDKFNFSQSWGWKSSTLMLDDGMLSDEGETMQVGVLDMPPDGGVADGGAAKAKAERSDGRLRFMVVIGNI
jgi:hypothetical protein